MRTLTSFLLLLLYQATPLFAQEETFYTVQVGNFVDAKSEDFEGVRSFGFVYARQLDNNLHQIYLGGFEEKSEAQRVAQQLRSRGYNSAAVRALNPREGRTLTVIQIETLRDDRPVDWAQYQQFENLHAILSEDKIKLAVGPYRNVEEARQKLTEIRKTEFSDAFIKRVNSVFLHEVGAFESGIKKPLIPLDLQADNSRRPASQAGAPPARGIPQSYGDVSARSPEAGRGEATAGAAAPGSAETATIPDIRSNVRRASVRELQKVLKAEGAYDGAIDGLYGSGTRSGYERLSREMRELQKYRILSRSLDLTINPGADDRVQRAINNLLNNGSAINVLESSNAPAAKGYRAYVLFNSLGPGNEVNALMNEAIRQAYSGQRLANQAPFDYNATYAYQDLEQLILHLHYIHSAPGNDYAAPCWLYRRHPRETAAAYQRFANNPSLTLKIQSCDQFLQWPELRLATAIAFDLNPNQNLSTNRLQQAATQRAELYLAGTALPEYEKQAVTRWNRRLWEGLNRWSAADPMHSQIVKALKVAYYQSQVRLEDYFMDQGYNAEEAEGLALATLKTLVGYHLERFV